VNLDPADIGALHAEHTADAVRARIAVTPPPSYLGDAVLGAIDGAITTFAVVAATLGGELPPVVAFILGVSNLVADGFSMAASNYQRARAEQHELARARRIEGRHIDLVPDGERREIRAIYAAKGFDGETLDRIVDTITADRGRWIDTMLVEEWGLRLDPPNALRAGLVTFGAFAVVGAVPLVPLVLEPWIGGVVFVASAVLTLLTFFGIGVAKGKVLGHPWLRSGLETLGVGGGAAILAWGGGWAVRRIVEGFGWL
jgi:VIT1/CCC1 family predicted Fe2+/Mn2+ transporter